MMHSRSFLFLLAALSLTFAAQSSFAKILITSTTGASRYTLATEETPTVSIFGGTAGDPCTNSDNVSTCNSCATASGLEACNTNRIYSSLVLRIFFSSDSTTGYPMIATAADTSSGTASGTKIGNLTAVSVGSGSTAVAEATWGEICQALGSDANCDKPISQGSIRIGISTDNDDMLNGSDDTAVITIKVADPNKDSDGTRDTTFNTNKGCSPAQTDADAGICDFTASPGDGKVFLQGLELGTASTNTPITGLRVIASKTNFFCDFTEDVIIRDLNISTTASNEISLDNSIVDDLDNGTLYFFRLASIDAAGNIFAFTDDEVLSECGTYSCSGSRDVSNIDATCPYIARPDEVLGLLTEDFNCFIATAAYGSPLDQRLNVLRLFRSQILTKFDLGQRFVNFYYKKGPYAARWVADHPWSRPILQGLIWPLWLFSWISVHWGLGISLSLLLLIISLPLGVFLYLRRQEKIFG